MKRNVNRIISNSRTLGVILLGLAFSTGPVWGQRTPGNSAPVAGGQKAQPLSSSCVAQPTFGSGETKFALCISNHGNILKIESPAGHDPIVKEGYRLCYNYSSLFAYDNGPEESGWGPSTVSGSVNLPLTITRSTTDGQFRLVQVFSRNNNE